MGGMNALKRLFFLLSLPLFVIACSSSKQVRKPLSFRVVNTTLAKAIDDKETAGIPLNPTTTFFTQDPEIISHVKLRNLSGKHALRWEWYDPNGNLYYATKDHSIHIPKGKYVAEATVWHKISLRGERAQKYPGNWKVDIHLDDALIASNAFEIKPKPVILPPMLSVDVDFNVPETNMKNPHAIAVIVGNRNYDHKDVPPVLYAYRDAETMKQYLVKTLGYKEGNIIFEYDATKVKFEALFGIAGNHRGTLYDYIKPNKSDVFIYYSGHGAPDPNTKKGYFVPVNCDPAKVVLNGYSLDTFYENLSKLDAKRITVVIDACFSGGTSLGGSLISCASPTLVAVSNPAIAKGNTVCLTSSQGDQISSWCNEKQHGLFTYFFLRAIGGSADMNADKLITFQEIYDYVSDRSEGVPYWARRLHSGRLQTPTMLGRNNEEVLVRY